MTGKCAYCGTVQTWDSAGTHVCSHCGATQPEQAGSAEAGAGKLPFWRTRAAVLLLVVALICGVSLIISQQQKSQSKRATPAPIVNGPGISGPAPVMAGRMGTVTNPSIRTVPAGTDLSVLDALRSAPGSKAAMFDTRMLAITNPRPMRDPDGTQYFVGELVNHSPTVTAIAPTVYMTLYKGGRRLESTDMEFSDLPPGGHAPMFFSWNGTGKDIDHYQFRYKPVQAASPGEPRANLQASVTAQKLEPNSVQINFGPVRHYTTQQVQGVLVNRGNATAKNIQLFLTLRDALGRITGYKEQDVNELGPGESMNYTISADQWDGPVASFDVLALTGTEPKL